MLQSVCVLDQLLTDWNFCSTPHPTLSLPLNFFNAPTTLNLLFLPKRQFLNQKSWRLGETSVWFVHVTDLHSKQSRPMRFWWGKFEQLWLCFGRKKHTCTMKQLFLQSEKRGYGGLRGHSYIGFHDKVRHMTFRRGGGKMIRRLWRSLLRWKKK